MKIVCTLTPERAGVDDCAGDFYDAARLMRFRSRRHVSVTLAAMLAVAGLVGGARAQDEDLLVPQGPAGGQRNQSPRPTGSGAEATPQIEPSSSSVLGSALPYTNGTPRLSTDAMPTDYLQVEAQTVQTFDAEGTQIVQINEPVTFHTPDATLTAQAAVMWVSRAEGSPLNRQRVQIALIGQATLTQPGIERTGDKLFVSILVGGSLRLAVQDRQLSDPRGSDLYKAASDIRPLTAGGADVENNVMIQRPWIDVPATTQADTTQPTTLPTPPAPVTFSAGDVQTTTSTPDGKIAAVLRGSVLLVQHRPNGDLIEMQAQECVLFTSLTDFGQLSGNGPAGLQNAIVSAYLEGDVRVNFTPSIKNGRQAGEQRMRADRVFYEFGTDRAVMTNVVVQSKDPKLPFPITIRANAAKQLSMGEYATEKTTITTSQFAAPSYALNAKTAYIRQHNDNDGYGSKTDYVATSAVYRVFGVPLLYLPYTAGEETQNAQLVRNLELGSRRGFGFGVQTQWGLFESLGKLPPPGIDATYNVDYFSDRGPAFGFDTKYKGGLITADTKDAWNFDGDFSAYLIHDDGEDDVGRYRGRVDHDDDYRGRIEWEHQHILPDDWQLQLRAGYTSDPTFLEEFYEKPFDDGLPTNLSAYVKHQTDTEALTFLMEYQPSNEVTTADALHNQFPGVPGKPLSNRPFEVDRLPEVGYYRLGDSLADDQLTFFSENHLGGYVFHEANDPLGNYDGVHNDNYAFGGLTDRGAHGSATGIPSLGYTGTSGRYVVRGDLRQEVDWPLEAGQLKVVPYVMGRYTGYSDSPEDDPQNRVIAGAGLRATTAFWKTDDSAESDFFDIHRVRHVIEPEVDLFTSGGSVDRNDLYIYDDTIDGVSDISAASFWIRQRWQTKRGGPGLWRSVDFLTFDVGIVGVTNKPDFPNSPFREAIDENPESQPFGSQVGPLNARNFRGLFFESTPEASIPHSSLAMSSTWRFADTSLILADANMNLDHQDLATAGIGFLAGRGDRITYFTGLRYIGEVDSTIASFAMSYQLTLKYTVNFSIAVDLDRTSSKGGSVSIVRKFDRFFIGAGAYYDAVENQSGFTVSFYPEGLQGSVNSGQLSSLQ